MHSGVIDNPAISIVMSVYNEPEDYLRASIESILNQTFKDLEFIIILDNPGKKSAVEILNSYAAGDKRIKIILNKENQGLAVSLNKGFSIARGKFIARMDADDVSLPHRLKAQLAFMENNPNVSLIGSSIIYIDEKDNILDVHLSSNNYEFLKRYIFYGGTPCFHPTWFFRKTLLDKMNGYRLLPTSQDYDFLMRVFYSGIKVSNIEEPLLCYRIHFNKITAQKNIYQLRLTHYIMKAVRKGFIMDDNRFSKSSVNRVLRVSKIFLFFHKFSLQLLTVSFKFRRGYRRIIALMLIFLSVIISPYQVFHGLYRIIVRPLMLRLRK